jgi:hypothetical protein
MIANRPRSVLRTLCASSNLLLGAFLVLTATATIVLFVLAPATD